MWIPCNCTVLYGSTSPPPQADRLRNALAQREKELSQLNDIHRRALDQRDHTEHLLQDKLAQLQLDQATVKQQHDAKLAHMERELRAANDKSLTAQDEAFS